MFACQKTATWRWRGTAIKNDPVDGDDPNHCLQACTLHSHVIFTPMLNIPSMQVGNLRAIRGSRQLCPWVPGCPLPGSHPRLHGALAQPAPVRLTPGLCHLSGRPRRVQCHSTAPWTDDDLAEMSLQQEQLQEATLGDYWRSRFQGDLDVLYDYADRDEAEWEHLLSTINSVPKNQRLEATLSAKTFTPALANTFIGMGTWRLKSSLDPVITFLAERLEGTWREACEDDLNLYPRDKWKNKYDVCDSMDPARELNGWSYADIPTPEQGQEGYPRLVLENRVYCSRVFRKLHLELGWRQDGLQVLHAVLYPRYNFDIPILAMDIVVSKGQVTLAIIDACPVRKDKQLPAHYLETMSELQAHFLTDAQNQRRIPEWGQAIFSPACVCIRPDSPEELVGFLRYAVALHRAHMSLSTLVSPLDASDPRQAVRLEELLQGHKSFVENQLANKKTTRVLEAAFGTEWTDAYMRDMMFDFTPGDEPAYEDASLAQLFNYFEENPELGSRPQEWAALQAEVELENAEAVLGQLISGQPVSEDRLESALQAMFEYDDDFQRNCLILLPELTLCQSPQEVGALLALHLDRLGLGTPVKRWTSTTS